MAESQKETSSGQPKKKNSLLDLDFGNDDFLSSWKTVSVAGDGTDLDFGSISKGKKNAFNFDKMDMDFNLDDDLGKIPSFNLDIPGIDISSPVKKDGKSKERSKESTSGSTREKADGFDFTFDFNDLDDFNFKAISKKEGAIAKEGEAKEDSSNQLFAQKPRDCLGENVDTHLHESSNLEVSGTVISSDVDMQGGAGGSPELSNPNSLYNPVENDESHLDSEVATNEGPSDKAMTDKTGSDNSQELDYQLEKSMSPESLPQEVPVANESIADKSVHSVLRNEFSRDTVPALLEEVSMGDTKACTLESAKTLMADSSSNSEIPAWSGSVHTTAITEEKETGSQGHTENDALVDIKEGEEPVQSGIKDREILSDNGSPKLVPQKQGNVKNQDLLEHSSTLNRTATNFLMPNKEREAVTRSKYFNQPDKTESRILNASNRTTGSSINANVTGIIQKSPPDGSKKGNAVEFKRDNKVDGVCSLSSASVIVKEHSQTQSLRSGSEYKKSSSHINTLGLTGMKINSGSKNCANPSSLAMTSETSENRKTSVGAGDKVSSVKAIKHIPTLSSLTTLRTSGVNLGSLKSQPHNDTMLSRYVQQHMNVAGSTPSRTVEVAEPKKQTPPAPSLKRKMNEACSSDLVLKPLKRFTGSPITRVSAENSGKMVDSKACDKENIPDKMGKNACENQNNSNLASPNQVFMNELEVSSSLDYDSNIEMADACSKGLEDICNLLSKKHEEAKELLVRAVVNNNRLLMLNHPIYEEKISFTHQSLFLTDLQADTYTNTLYLFMGNQGIKAWESYLPIKSSYSTHLIPGSRCATAKALEFGGMLLTFCSHDMVLRLKKICQKP
ncbi:OLC1v1021375C2 [Oldenlandia corymbosa var. corymbosa]|uniref:OLC1v1021375C2 n=1 Tax=Oldenlandia corymbosa var. corymbosa TaxID=529605 RepID=A0AAV1BVI1_OLDCO|nr:OLC1v1021375C2 [Oldenlandia corymbosa var. corymbosa]